MKPNDTNKGRTQGRTSQSSEDTIEEERRSPPLVIPEHCEDDAQSFSTTSTRSDLVGPGRALGVLYSKAGRILDRTANLLAHKMGFGPYAIYLRILDSTEFWSACKVLHPLLIDGGRRKVWPVVRSGYDKMLNYALTGTPRTRYTALHCMQKLIMFPQLNLLGDSQKEYVYRNFQIIASGVMSRGSQDDQLLARAVLNAVKSNSNTQLGKMRQFFGGVKHTLKLLEKLMETYYPGNAYKEELLEITFTSAIEPDIDLVLRIIAQKVSTNPYENIRLEDVFEFLTRNLKPQTRELLSNAVKNIQPRKKYCKRMLWFQNSYESLPVSEHFLFLGSSFRFTMNRLIDALAFRSLFQGYSYTNPFKLSDPYLESIAIVISILKDSEIKDKMHVRIKKPCNQETPYYSQTYDYFRDEIFSEVFDPDHHAGFEDILETLPAPTPVIQRRCEEVFIPDADQELIHPLVFSNPEEIDDDEDDDYFLNQIKAFGFEKYAHDIYTFFDNSYQLAEIFSEEFIVPDKHRCDLELWRREIREIKRWRGTHRGLQGLFIEKLWEICYLPGRVMYAYRSDVNPFESSCGYEPADECFGYLNPRDIGFVY